MNRSLKKILPIIISDIDGVLIQEQKAILGVPEALKQVRKPLCQLHNIQYANEQKSQLPFILLTNNQYNNQIEQQRIGILNSQLGLLTPYEMLMPSQLVMNYTAIKPHLQQYKDKLILVAGIDDEHIFLKDSGITNFITLEEYAALFPFLVPISKRSQADIEPTRQKIQKRLNLSEINLQEPLQINAVFILGEVVKWEECVQIICDLLTTSDGKIAQVFPNPAPEKTIQIYVSSNTIIYRERGQLPKVGCGMLQLAIDQCYQLMHHKSIPKSTFKTFGKPQRSAFEVACNIYYQFINLKILFKICHQVQKALELIDEQKYQAGQIYMIGDNYNQDILGAKEMGWKTILVKQGQNKQGEKHNSDYIVKDFQQAVKLIFKKHQFNYDI
ncbi:hypothetical protein ABPG72_017988 [Tetrahymena utriculariae]